MRLLLLKQHVTSGDDLVGVVERFDQRLVRNDHHFANRLNSGISGPEDGPKQTVNAALTTIVRARGGRVHAKWSRFRLTCFIRWTHAPSLRPVESGPVESITKWGPATLVMAIRGKILNYIRIFCELIQLVSTAHLSYFQQSASWTGPSSARMRITGQDSLHTAALLLRGDP